MPRRTIGLYTVESLNADKRKRKRRHLTSRIMWMHKRLEKVEKEREALEKQRQEFMDHYDAAVEALDDREEAANVELAELVARLELFEKGGQKVKPVPQ